MAEERRILEVVQDYFIRPPAQDAIATRQELLYKLFPLNFVRDDIPFRARLVHITNTAKGGKNFKVKIIVDSKSDTKQVFNVNLTSQTIKDMFQEVYKKGNINQYYIKDGGVRMLENLIYAQSNFIPEKDDEDGLSLNGAYIPLDKSIREKIKKREGLIDALRDGEKIVQVFHGDVTESVPINFVCNMLGLDDQSNIKTDSSFQITMTAEELEEKGFKNNDLAIAVRKALGSKQILSHLEKNKDRTIYSKIKSKNVLNKKDELKRLRLILGKAARKK